MLHNKHKGSVWVNKCFFWYWITRGVLNKGLLNGLLQRDIPDCPNVPVPVTATSLLCCAAAVLADFTKEAVETLQGETAICSPLSTSFWAVVSSTSPSNACMFPLPTDITSLTNHKNLYINFKQYSHLMLLYTTMSEIFAVSTDVAGKIVKFQTPWQVRKR